MQIITTHNNSDFDALASMVAASYLYPEAWRVMPRQAQPGVREFVSVHWDLLQLHSRRAVDLAACSRLIVTDTSDWERLDQMQDLAEREDLETIVWDHHPGPGSIPAGELHREEVGAVVTLLLERLQAADVALSPMHATLFLLGIYDDTGALTYPSTTPRDAYMAAYLLDNGADLNVVGAYLDNPLDERHLELFNRMLAESELLDVRGVRIGICVQPAHKGLNMLAGVVSRFREIKGLDVVFGIFSLAPGKTVIVGRGNPSRFDVGAVLRHFGGGGHPGAGSAMQRSDAAQVYSQLLEFIHAAEIQQVTVRDLMAPITEVLSTQQTLSQASEQLRKSGRSALLVQNPEGRTQGILALEHFGRIRDDEDWQRPVTSMMQRDFVSASPEQSLRDALRLMVQAEIGLLPVSVDGQVIGEITRAAIILNLYTF